MNETSFHCLTPRQLELRRQMVSASERKQERSLALLHSQWVHRYGFSSLPVMEAVDLLTAQKPDSIAVDILDEQEVEKEVEQESERENISPQEVVEAYSQEVLAENIAPVDVSPVKKKELFLERSRPSDLSPDDESSFKGASKSEANPKTEAKLLEAPSYLRKLEQFTTLIGDCLDEVGSTLREDSKPLLQVGTVLRRAREQQGLSIDALAKSLRIGEEQLLALEKGDEGQLPEPVFIKAMVRRVAERLHLDETPLIKQLQGANLSGEGVQSQPVQSQPVQSQSVQSQPVQRQQVEAVVQSNAAQFQPLPDSAADSAMDLASQSSPPQSQAPLFQEPLPHAPLTQPPLSQSPISQASIAPPPPPALNKLRRWLPGADE